MGFEIADFGFGCWTFWDVVVAGAAAAYFAVRGSVHEDGVVYD